VSSDNHNLKILRMLLEDSRMSLTEVSRKAGLSRFAVKNRIEKLFNEGIIFGSTVVLNPSLVGFRRTVFFEFKTNPHEPWLAKLLEKTNACDLLDGIAGEYSLFSRFRMTDDEHFSRILKKIDDAVARSHFKKYRVVNAIHIFKEAGVPFKNEEKGLKLDEVDLRILEILQLQAEFVAAVQIILYIGGVMVLFLFVIVLVNLGVVVGQERFNRQWWIAGLAALVLLGVEKLAAHLFVFYFGIIADITPPVALAAYAGAGIAKANPFKTGVTATKLAIGAFVVPYIFVYNPAMVLIGTTPYLLSMNLVTACGGMFGLGAAMIGFCLAPMNWFERIWFAVAGLMLIDPGILTDAVGVAMLIVGFVVQWRKSRAIQRQPVRAASA